MARSVSRERDVSAIFPAHRRTKKLAFFRQAGGGLAESSRNA
jgi:hypothetical protein